MSAEQEYDAQADLVDDDDEAAAEPIQLSAGPGPHPPFFGEHEPAHSMAPPSAVEAGTPIFATAPELYGSCDGARPGEDPFPSWPNLAFANPFAFPSGHVR